MISRKSWGISTIRGPTTYSAWPGWLNTHKSSLLTEILRLFWEVTGLTWSLTVPLTAYRIVNSDFTLASSPLILPLLVTVVAGGRLFVVVALDELLAVIILLDEPLQTAQTKISHSPNTHPLSPGTAMPMCMRFGPRNRGIRRDNSFFCGYLLFYSALGLLD